MFVEKENLVEGSYPIRLAAVVKKLSEGVAKQLSDNKIL